MDAGARAVSSGCLAFIAAALAVYLINRDGYRLDVMTIGGLTGGAVALSAWMFARRNLGE